jgi:hypothetical protein
MSRTGFPQPAITYNPGAGIGTGISVATFGAKTPTCSVIGD